MKRKTLLFSLILVMACMSLALLGSDTPDGNLSMDEDDFVELVVDAPLSLHYLESVYSLKAVNQIVGNEGEDGFAEVLYNANDEAEYVLATAEEGGYAIFHRMTGALMEAGEFGTSPYAGQSGKKYYFGPSNYAVKDVNDVTTDIMRGGVMTTEQITAMHQNMVEKRALVVDRSETKSYANMLSALQTANTAGQQGDASLMNVVPGDWATNPYAEGLSISNFTNVANSHIFEYSYGKQAFGDNKQGSCSIVSLVLLMKYYDMTVSPSLIPATIEDIPQDWYDECAQAPSIIGTSGLYECDILPSDSVYEALHKFLITVSETNKLGVSRYCEQAAIRNYGTFLPRCVYINLEQNVESDDVELYNKIKAKINANVPVALSIKYRMANATEDSNHSVVVYGYLDSGEEGGYYRTHFGWDGCSSIIVPHIFANAYYDTLSVTTYDQYHASGTCTESGCFSIGKHTKTPIQYGHICSCGESTNHSGTDATIIWQDYVREESNIAPRYDFIAEDERNYLYGTYNTYDHHFYACNDCFEYMYGYRMTKVIDWEDDINNLDDVAYYFPGIFMAPHVQGDIHVSGGKCVTSCVYCGQERDASHMRGAVYADSGKCMTQCTRCGTALEIPHTGTLTYKAGLTTHTVTCSFCGGSYQEGHLYLQGVVGCVICRPGGGLILSA